MSTADRTQNPAIEERDGGEGRNGEGSGVEVRVGGRVIPVAEGELL
jgi:hypothetical protein